MKLIVPVVILACAGLFAACSGDDDDTAETNSPSPDTQTTTVTAVATPVSVEGMFDAGGHELYLNCKGSGSPTIVYLHGYSHEQGDAGAEGGTNIQSLMRDQYRSCVYDRRNVGRSDEVPGHYTGLEAVADLHTLLDAAGVEPPYVLLGASYGGMISYLYAATYPEDVEGMVLLDAAFPGELDLELLFPEGERFTHEEFYETDERLDQLAAYEEAQDLPTPAIPVTYMLATPSAWPLGVAAYDDVIHDRIREYAESFSPGKMIEVESPHYMEAAVPEAIVEELEKVVATAIGGGQ